MASWVVSWAALEESYEIMMVASAEYQVSGLGWSLNLTALVATMAVNTLMTGLIVFKILKAFLEVKHTLGSFNSASGRSNYRHIAFIIIESGMALFVAHLGRILVTILLGMPTLQSTSGYATYYNLEVAFPFIVSFHQMLNVIISSVHFYSFVY